MKLIILILSVILLNTFCIAQQTLERFISHDGIQREYLLYIPANYTGTSATPLVINFHGYGSYAGEQMTYGDFRSIADSVGFLIVHPQGTLFNGTTHWNVGGWTAGSTVDDVGFTEALIDSLSIMYNIDNTRVYATGMSNGGFMSFLLACQLSDRIAAIASVTGSMTPETFNNSNPQHPTPVLQMHSPSDPVVPYNGASWTKSIDDVLQYWVGYNNCSTTPDITILPDLDPNDGSTVEYMVYEGGDNGVNVEHYKIIGGGHTWPGSVYTFPGTNYDINASSEIWKFFSKYDISGLINLTDIIQPINKEIDLNIYPNPTASLFTIEGLFSEGLEYELISSIGNMLIHGVITSNKQQIDISQLPANIYFLKIGNRIFKISKTK